ncbi:putative quinol monooxygenase [Roseibium sp. RKSG952]|uniref:putative quinol monooxygenase n=1 Tax=Roseibium sp. RKSG952 TaxID=2529384 RepID=UPI0018AD1ADC|nr:putative quinol monooxygenase [Roseibium sp. RKSG952]
MNMPILVFASFQPKDGQEQAVKDILMDMVPATRAELGNQLYELSQQKSLTGDVSYHLFEKYADSEALATHKASDYYQDYRKRIEPLLKEPIAVKVLQALENSSNVAGSNNSSPNDVYLYNDRQKANKAGHTCTCSKHGK